MPPSIPLVIGTKPEPAFRCHWKVGVGVPLAEATKLVLAPLQMVELEGLPVITAAEPAAINVCVLDAPAVDVGVTQAVLSVKLVATVDVSEIVWVTVAPDATSAVTNKYPVPTGNVWDNEENVILVPAIPIDVAVPNKVAEPELKVELA